MCRVLGVSVSGYYEWAQRPESNRSKQSREIKEKIKKIFKTYKETYGSPRIAVELQKLGMQCSRPRTARLMHDLGLRAKAARKFKGTTDSSHNHPVAPNLLGQEFHADAPNKVWSSDITYIRTGIGWLYLTVILDLFNREIVGYSFSRYLTAKTTVIPALDMAVINRTPGKELIVHSDRGVQYACKDFRDKLETHEMIQSMSGTGNCYDNAITETFFKSLKVEWIYGRTFRNHQEARQSIFEYIEIFYNRKRRHSALEYLSPVDFLNLFQQTKRLAS